MYYYKKNIFGDILSIFDNNGQEIVKYVYDAWGKHKTYLDNGNFVDIETQTSYTQSGSNNKVIAELNPFRYSRGYYYDSETGLYYLNSRYYEPNTCRFINADDISMLEVTQNSINGLNLYAYCLNNPVNDSDTEGKASWWQWLLFGIGAALVVAAAVVLTVTSGGAFAGLAGSIIVGAAKGAFIGAAVGSVVGVAGGAVYSAVTGAALGQSILSGFLMGFGIGAIVGVVIGGAVGGVQYSSMFGRSFSGMGKLVKNQNIKWTSTRLHAGSRMIERGITYKNVQNTLRRGLTFQQTVDKFLIVGSKSSIIITKAGELITLWAKNNNSETIIDAIKTIMGL